MYGDNDYNSNIHSQYDQEQNTWGSQDPYRPYNDDTMRWHPEPEKYNSAPQGTPPSGKKPGRKWWIPLTIVLALLVAAIGIGGVFGLQKLREKISENHAQAEAAPEETIPEYIIEDAQTAVAETGGSSFILTDVSDIVKQAMPTVVSITSRTLVNNNSYWGFFFGAQGAGSNQAEEVEAGIGSGTIVGQNERELLILTSYHVVEGCSSLYVTFNDDTSVDGYIKSVSEENDIAIVAVPIENISQGTLRSIRIATLSREEVEVGQGVIVIGDALGYGQSVVTGIISAVNREIIVDGKTIITLQTDAAINQGNSGGCMLNARGEVVGISEAKVGEDMVEGMCYAIPVYNFYDLIQELLVTTNVVQQEEENTIAGDEEDFPEIYLGIYGYDIDSEMAEQYDLHEGVYILSVFSGSGAERAGLGEGDIIIGLNGETIKTTAEIQTAIAEMNAGDKVTLTVLKLGSNGYTETEVEVTLTKKA